MKNSQWRCQIETIGGTTNGNSIAITSGNLLSQSLNISTWAQSVTDNTSKLVELDWNGTYPIYDFITDSTKKAQIKAAVERYIIRKQIEIVKIKPLYRYRNKSARYLYTSDWNEVGNGSAHGFTYEGITGYLYNAPVAETIPLYRFWDKKIHFYTTSRTEGWGNYEGIVGYVYPN